MDWASELVSTAGLGGTGDAARPRPTSLRAAELTLRERLSERDVSGTWRLSLDSGLGKGTSLPDCSAPAWTEFRFEERALTAGAGTLEVDMPERDTGGALDEMEVLRRGRGSASVGEMDLTSMVTARVRVGLVGVAVVTGEG